jgi:branched-chain amino acid transport system substrate-binding protein
MAKFISIWWPTEDDARGAGEGARGFKELNWHGVGTNYRALQDIQKYVVDKGLSQVAKEKVGEVLYNHGVYNSMLIAEAIHNAQTLTGKKVVTGEDVRRGLETIDLTPARFRELGLDDFAPPLRLSCADHNGHGPLFVQQWDGAKYAKTGEQVAPMSDAIRPLIEAAGRDYLEKNTGWPKRSEACDRPS